MNRIVQVRRYVVPRTGVDVHIVDVEIADFNVGSAKGVNANGFTVPAPGSVSRGRNGAVASHIRATNVAAGRPAIDNDITTPRKIDTAISAASRNSQIRPRLKQDGDGGAAGSVALRSQRRSDCPAKVNSVPGRPIARSQRIDRPCIGAIRAIVAAR